MKTRIITGVVACFVLVPILIFSGMIVFPIGIAFCSVLAVYEMLGCIGLKKSISISIPLYTFAATFPFLIRYVGLELTGKIALAALLLTVLYYFGILIFSHGKYSLQNISVCLVSMIYILFGFNAIIVLRDCTSGGQYLYLICFLGAWITDTFAYFTGVFFGKHKLIPEVSPKKTIEGSIGGSIFCILALIVYGLIVERIDTTMDAKLIVFAIAGVLSSLVSQIGDLSMSVIKRNYGVKDYGWIFPGHGGILDRFDSVLAVSIVLLLINTFFPFLEVL